MTDIMDGISPLPWSYNDEYSYLDSSNDGSVCWIPTGFHNIKDAAYIVHACNAYPGHVAAIAELVEALEQFEAHYPSGINPFLDAAANKARTLIAKHKGAS